MSLSDIIRENRPSLSASSVRTYTSILSSLARQLADGQAASIDFFAGNIDKIIDHLANVPPKRRKTTLSALVVATEGSAPAATKRYRELMLKDSEAAEKDAKKQEMSEKEKERWVSWDTIQKKYVALEKEVKPLMAKEEHTTDELQKIQNYVILSFYTLVPPRRLMDYTEFKQRDINKDEDNYFEKGKLIFNRYKTSKYYARQEVAAPPKLKTILSKWRKINDSPYLLVDNYGNKLTPTKLNQRLNRIIKGVSVNMLRHIYITDNVLADVPALQHLEEVAEAMGHDLATQALYKRLK
jgi:integrase